MSDVDFKECRLIENCLCYLTFDEFFKYRRVITKSFNDLSKDGKLFYKFYVYANIHMKLNYKDAIWSYINSPTIENEIHLVNLSLIYKPYTIKWIWRWKKWEK